MRVVSLFAGIGGFDLGFERAGMEVVAQVEKDAQCRELLAAKWPGAVPLEDVCTSGAANLPACDVVCGGSPCQGFSVAGLRGGRKDERSNLTSEFVRTCDEIRPAVVVWENVPGVLSMHDNSFGHFLAAMVGEDEPFVCSDGEGWPSAGVAVGPRRACGWRVLDAQWFGVAQRRRRVFLVGVAHERDGGNAGDSAGAERVIQILFEPEGMRGHPAPSREAREDVAGTLGGGAAGGGVPDVAKSRCAHSEGVTREDMHTLVTAPLTGNPYGDHESRESLLVPDVAYACSARDGKGADSDCTSGTLIPFNARQDPVIYGGTCGPLDSDGFTNAVAFKPSHYTRDKDGAPSEIVPPLSADADKGDQEPVVLAVRGRGDGRQLETRQDGTANAIVQPNGGRDGMGVGAVMHRWGVRRLTPREAERLQGFQWRLPGDVMPGAWVDELGRWWSPDYTAGFSDSARYRMLGNAVAVPCAEWIGHRIAAVWRGL